jgi:hypothetical protein
VTKRALLTPRRRVVNDAELAAYLNRSVSWLGQNRHSLEAQGFPRRLPVVGGNDLDAVDQWLDRLHTTVGASTSSSVDADALWRRATGTTPNVRN